MSVSLRYQVEVHWSLLHRVIFSVAALERGFLIDHDKVYLWPNPVLNMQ